MTRQLFLLVLVSCLGLAAVSGCTTSSTLRDAGTEELDAPLIVGFDGGGGIDAGPRCMVGTIDCGGTCTRVAWDENHCGSCGNRCPEGITCASGECNCAAPMLSCRGICLDPMTDIMNCGACGNVCAELEMCTGGECIVHCDPPGMICYNTVSGGGDGGVADLDAEIGEDAGVGAEDAGAARVAVCADLTTDPNNCGHCNSRCVRGSTCIAGACACPAGQQICGGSCVDALTDPLNCGSCGTTCGTGGSCAGGMCTCGTDRTNCSGRCVDVITDRNNCGMCARRCDLGETCEASLCSCVAPRRDCGTGCSDPMTDPLNCGTCGTNCGPGGVCAAGICTCAAGLTMCGTSCRNTMTDLANCSACGMVCPPLTGGICAGGACTCPTGQMACSGACLDVMFDRNNCGTCGMICPGAEVCLMGSCSAAPPTRYMQTTPVAGTVPFIDACSAPGHTEHLATTDDAAVRVPLTFPFRYWATNLAAGAQVNVCTNGFINLDGTAQTSLGGSIGTGTPNALIAPHWGDNYTRGPICVATVGTAPNRQFVVQWNHEHYCCTATPAIDLTYEVILSEGSGIIDIAYGTMMGARAQAMGIENQTGAMVINSCPGGTGMCAPTTDQRIRYVPIP